MNSKPSECTHNYHQNKEHPHDYFSPNDCNWEMWNGTRAAKTVIVKLGPLRTLNQGDSSLLWDKEKQDGGSQTKFFASLNKFSVIMWLNVIAIVPSLGSWPKNQTHFAFYMKRWMFKSQNHHHQSSIHQFISYAENTYFSEPKPSLDHTCFCRCYEIFDRHSSSTSATELNYESNLLCSCFEWKSCRHFQHPLTCPHTSGKLCGATQMRVHLI